MRLQKEEIYLLVGPTAVGKTDISIQLAKRMNADIISADSIQIYRGLDIGSAKPSMKEREGIAHHMIDVADISDATFSVAKYQEAAFACIADIHARGKRAIVVGGSGLYINALTHPLHFTNIAGNDTLRKELIALEEETPGILHKNLSAADPVTAARLHPNDTKRVLRALEVLKLSGKALSAYEMDFVNTKQAETRYRAKIAGLTMDRQTLYARIEQRVDGMLENGLLEEVEKLYNAEYSRSLPALNGLGYKQLLRYYHQETDKNSAIEDIKRETRRFAKRQWTWFKRDANIAWFDITPPCERESIVEKIETYFFTNDGEGDTKYGSEGESAGPHTEPVA